MAILTERLAKYAEKVRPFFVESVRDDGVAGHSLAELGLAGWRAGDLHQTFQRRVGAGCPHPFVVPVIGASCGSDEQENHDPS